MCRWQIMKRIVKDTQQLMAITDDEVLIDTINLWDDKDELVQHGVNYSEGF